MNDSTITRGVNAVERNFWAFAKVKAPVHRKRFAVCRLASLSRQSKEYEVSCRLVTRCF